MAISLIGRPKTYFAFVKARILPLCSTLHCTSINKNIIYSSSPGNMTADLKILSKRKIIS